MANPTIVAVAEPTNNPPRVRLTVTDTGTPNVTQVAVTRTRTAGGLPVPVRTPDGALLTLSPSGGNRVGVLYDYEAPFGVQHTYRVLQNPSASASATLDVSLVWLIHPGVPELSQQVKVTEMAERTREVRDNVIYPIARERPVVVTDGARKAPSGTLSLRTRNLTQLDAINALIDDAGVLFLNVPPALGWGIASDYYALGTSTERRLLRWGAHPYRDWSFPYRVVDRPEGGGRPVRDLADILSQNLNLSAIKAKYATLAGIRDDLPGT